MVTDPPYGVDYSGANKTMYYNGERKQPRKRIKGDHSPDSGYALLKSVLDRYAADVLYAYSSPQWVNRALDVGRQFGRVFANIAWVKLGTGYAALGARYKPRYESVIAVETKGDTLWIGPDDENTVWEIDVNHGHKPDHPTEKPVECMQRPIRNHKGDVYEPFCGSGTTIIAAENEDRTCYAMEIDPAYCAVILERCTGAGMECSLIE